MVHVLSFHVVLRDMVASQEKPETIEARAAALPMPCCVIWGKNDKVLNSVLDLSVLTFIHCVCVYMLIVLGFILLLSFLFLLSSLSLSLSLSPPQVCDVSGARLMKKMVKNCRVFIINNCGHALSIEKPLKCAKLLERFVQELTNHDTVIST